jgi:benzoate/toluate 1,2-dioxygenase beta subunit
MKLTRAQAEDFLYLEAHLLDQRRYDDWLNLFTSDGVYWLPMEDGTDPELVPSILHDTREMLELRIRQYDHPSPRYAQFPPSRTIHAVTNVMVEPGATDEDALVRCTLMVTELREGDSQQLGLGEQQVYAGLCEFRLRRGEAPQELAIAMKKIVLINRDQPVMNLSFIM